MQCNVRNMTKRITKINNIGLNSIMGDSHWLQFAGILFGSQKEMFIIALLLLHHRYNTESACASQSSHFSLEPKGQNHYVEGVQATL